jgi:protein involved in polysaccharide export with SLBB domain
MRNMWVPFGLLLSALTSASASSQQPTAEPSDVGETGSGLRPGDVISLKIWREPELSDTVRVDNDGIAVFPKLGPIRVTEIQPDSLERLLVDGYSRYLQNPSIDITFLRRITIWGAVVRPGPYPVDQTMTITDALALAGGPAQDGKSDRVELRRGGERTTLDLSGTARVWDTPLRSGDQLYVPQRSWFSRNTGLVLGAIGTATSLVFLIAR